MRPAPDPALPRALKVLRREIDLSQETTAIRAGMALSTYSRIERGMHEPVWSTLRAIASALDVSVVELAAEIERERQS